MNNIKILNNVLNNENILKKSNNYFENKLFFDENYSFNYKNNLFITNKFSTNGSFSNIIGYNSKKNSKLILKIPFDNENNESEVKILSILKGNTQKFLTCFVIYQKKVRLILG